MVTLLEAKRDLVGFDIEDDLSLRWYEAREGATHLLNEDDTHGIQVVSGPGKSGKTARHRHAEQRGGGLDDYRYFFKCLTES